MVGFTFKAVWKGLKGVRGKVSAAARAIGAGLASPNLDETLLASTVARFNQPGVHRNAQKAPSGVPWARPHPSTIRRRRQNKTANQALVDTGELKKSIAILGKKTSPSVLQSRGGGSIIIGVRPSSPAAVYARLQQEGGTTPQGNIVPARPFLGFSDEDIKQISGTVRKGILSRFLGR